MAINQAVWKKMIMLSTPNFGIKGFVDVYNTKTKLPIKNAKNTRK